MKIEIKNQRAMWHKPAHIWVNNGRVDCATPAYQWAVGMQYNALTKWWDENDRYARVVSAERMPRGGFLKHQVPVLQALLKDLLEEPGEPRRKPEIFFEPTKRIPMSRSRSRRTWKVLVKRLKFPGRTPEQIESIVTNCMFTAHSHYSKVFRASAVAGLRPPIMVE